MTDDLYERYKEALRVGHVAVLRGALEEAGEAYRSAASIAPSRALPHTSLGGVLMRLGRLEEALAEFAEAVARAPHDEGALLGQAEALNLAGLRVEAAVSLDHVSEVQEAAGRLPEAADTLRRAMELEDSTERARRQRGLLRQIRLSAGDQAAEQLLARALRLRDEPAAATEPIGSLTSSAPLRRWDTQTAPIVEAHAATYAAEEPASPSPAIAAPAPPERRPSDVQPAATAESEAEASGSASPDEERLAALGGGPWHHSRFESRLADEAASDREAVSSVVEEPAWPREVLTGAVTADEQPGAPIFAFGERQGRPTGDELMSAAEAAESAGDSTKLQSLLVGTARAYAQEGRFDAALDATHRLLSQVPSDVDAHLVLVELYVARDWNVLAVDKLVLLGRLADLNHNEETRQRLRDVVTRTFPKEERLLALCS